MCAGTDDWELLAGLGFTDDPTGEVRVEFRHGLRLPTAEATGARRRWAGRLARPALAATCAVSKRQCNQLAIIARRPTELYPWLQLIDGRVQFNPGYRANSRLRPRRPLGGTGR